MDENMRNLVYHLCAENVLGILFSRQFILLLQILWQMDIAFMDLLLVNWDDYTACLEFVWFNTFFHAV